MAAARAAAEAKKAAALAAQKLEETRHYTERFEGAQLRLFFTTCRGSDWYRKGWFDADYKGPEQQKKKKPEPVDGGGGEPLGDKGVAAEPSAITEGGDYGTVSTTTVGDGTTTLGESSVGPVDSVLTLEEGSVAKLHSVASSGKDDDDGDVEDETETEGGEDKKESEAEQQSATTPSQPSPPKRKPTLPPGPRPGGPGSSLASSGPELLPEKTPLPATWGKGVVVVKRRVVKLDLHANNLVGNLPGSRGTGNFPLAHTVPPLGDSVVLLGEMRVLCLFENSLIGEIPSSYGNFHKLQHLDLSHNHLEGDVPHSIFDIKTLKRVHLEENFTLTGTIPDTLCELQDLEAFTCHYNKMSGVLPEGVGKLAKLTEFSCHHNRFTGILPEGFKALPRLSRLFVNNNEMAVPSPELVEDITSSGVYPVSPRTGKDLNCVLTPQRVEGEESEEEEDSEESMSIDGSRTIESEGEED
jgi:hypothetical protein